MGRVVMVVWWGDTDAVMGSFIRVLGDGDSGHHTREDHHGGHKGTTRYGDGSGGGDRGASVRRRVAKSEVTYYMSVTRLTFH